MNEHAETAWPIAMAAISEATYQPLESVRAFLDSCHGRHFADEIFSQLYAGLTLTHSIESVCQAWMRRTTGYRARKDYGIPSGLPYLTGFVVHCDVHEGLTSA